MSVLVSVRPLNSESKMARADSGFDSVEMPKMSGRSLPENAVSGAFGLILSASDAAGRVASPITDPMASIETSAWRGMKHLKNRVRVDNGNGRDYANFEPRCQRCQAISQAGRVVVNALIHLTLPCHRHIDRLRRGDAGTGRTMLPPKARFLGDGIPLSV